MLAPIGTEGFAGTVHFSGPYPVVDRMSDENSPKTCAQFFDAEGFGPYLNREGRVRMACDMVQGFQQLLGKALINHSDAKGPKACQIRPNGKYEGVDLVLVVASAGGTEEKIREAIGLERELKYQGRSLFSVPT